MAIFDAYGKSIRTQALLRPSGLKSVRSGWQDLAIASGLTPTRLADLLKKSISGDSQEYFTLAEEMEERDPHYASVLATRKQAVAGLVPEVGAVSEDTKDIEIADQVRALVDAPIFGDLIFNLMDAVAKGYSIIEIDWQYGQLWMPKGYAWRDPRHFTIEGGLIHLRSDDGGDGAASSLAPFKFIQHITKHKSGQVIRCGLARLAAWSFMLKGYTMKDWMAFIEGYGQPLRIGRYAGNTSDEDIKTLWKAVAGMGSDAAAVLPESMSIEFHQAYKEGGGGSNVYENMAAFLDRQISKAVLGQTMTTDDGSSRSQAEVHDKVRMDIVRADARQLVVTLNRDLIRPFVDLNWGVQERCPTVSFPTPSLEERKALADIVVKLAGTGLPMSQKQIREIFGLAEPTEEDDRLDFPTRPVVDQAISHPGHDCPHCREFATAQGSGASDALDDLAQDEVAQWREVLPPLLDPIKHALADASSYKEAASKVKEAMQDMNIDDLASRLRDINFLARAHGDTDA